MKGCKPMNYINMRKHLKNNIVEKLIIVIGILILIYFLISLYFTTHFFFHTIINGVDVSLKSYRRTEDVIQEYIKAYELTLSERDNESEVIAGEQIDLKYNTNNNLTGIFKQQISLQWISSLFMDYIYYDKKLFEFNKDKLEQKIAALDCINHEITNPQNASFQYIKGSYHVIEEVYGNKVREDVLRNAISDSIYHGVKKLDLNKSNCYHNPKYTRYHEKTHKALNTLHLYVTTKITYLFGSKKEMLDGDTINNWLSINEDMEVIINRAAVSSYIKVLSKKYDTIGVTRSFKTSTGKTVEVKGGIYGWRINQVEEATTLTQSIKRGDILEKEPVYLQKAVSREENDIGKTYIEINITRQHLWFYRDGKLVTQGAIVTGNPNRGNATVLGTYMINYKQKEAVLKGLNYEAKVTYWMPFYGNIGLHDASWRSSFGGEIYKRRGTHGCVNAPHYLAKIIFQNIEAGVPVISYEE